MADPEQTVLLPPGVWYSRRPMSAKPQKPVTSRLTRADLANGGFPRLWGMVHLPPLAGSPDYDGNPHAAVQAALADAQALVDAGFDGVMVENYGDVPFFAEEVPAVTVAALARCAGAIRDRWPQLSLGVNCLRNDARAAVSIASAVGAQAVRINVHTGAALTDQGLVQGKAAATLRLRSQLDSSACILADVRVKHAAPMAPRSLIDEASDMRQRGMADALLVTGAGTGREADLEDARTLREALSDVPILVASGVTPDNAAQWSAVVDGAIVGSTLMRGGKAGAGVDPARAEAFLRAWTTR